MNYLVPTRYLSGQFPLGTASKRQLAGTDPQVTRILGTSTTGAQKAVGLTVLR